MKKTLHLKKTLRVALVALLLSVVGVGYTQVVNYDFEETCPSGQTLYYKIKDDGSLSVIPPRKKVNWTWRRFWEGFSEPTGDVIVPEQVRGYSVSEIGWGITESWNVIGAFMGCEITSIVIPNTVTSIATNAFENCDILTSVVIGNSVTEMGEHAFGYCDNLTSIVIPNSVTEIRENTFEGCVNLSSVVIPSSIEVIGGGAFADCDNLSVYYLGDIAQWCGISFLNSFVDEYNLYINNALVSELAIPDSVIIINPFSFANCNGLNSVTIGNSVTEIGEHAFYNCVNLASVVISNPVTTISEGAFKSCRNLTSVVIPNSVTAIGKGAFQGCGSLTSILLPNSIETINESVFASCYNLLSITIPNSVQAVGKHAFSGAIV